MLGKMLMAKHKYACFGSNLSLPNNTILMQYGSPTTAKLARKTNALFHSDNMSPSAWNANAVATTITMP
jgi:hypothetical protein